MNDYQQPGVPPAGPAYPVSPVPSGLPAPLPPSPMSAPVPGAGLSPAAPLSNRPSTAFVAASWVALFAGIGAYVIGLFNAQITLSEKGYYFTLLAYGLFAAVSVQKSVRDRLDGIRVTSLYYGIAWGSVILSLVMLVVGLWNVALSASERGFYAMAYGLALFASVAVQKNVRDAEGSAPETTSGFFSDI